jgi:GNAT superfamily N-acetyltransferase
MAGLAAELASVLADCVEGGASVGFVLPFTVEDARAWWLDALAEPGALTFVARPDDGAGGGRAVGVVRLHPVAKPNGSHRADVAKLLVHREARGRGVARALMDALEAEAARRGRWLLVLDTETGSPAEGLYARRGYERAGTVPAYAGVPDGTLVPTTFMWKRLPPGPDNSATA